MTIEKADVAAIRLCERRGMLATEGETAEAGLSVADYRARIGALKACGVVRSLSAVLVVPPLLGGDWVLAGVLANAKRPLGMANALAKKLPFVTETILNLGLPERLGPNFGLLFYSRDFETEARFIRSASGMEYQEVYRVADYSFPVAQPISADEKSLLRYMVGSPGSDVDAVAEALEKSPVWVRAKLDRLVWTEANRSGVLRIQPEVDWTKVENFGHFHFLIETGHRPEQLDRLAAEYGFNLVLGGRLYQDRYAQVEADVWGVADLLQRVALLNQVAGIRVAGVVWNERTIVNGGWCGPLLSRRAGCL